MFLFLPLQFFQQEIAQIMTAHSQGAGQGIGVAQLVRRDGQEIGNQRGYLFCLVRVKTGLAVACIAGVAQRFALDALAVSQPEPLQIVGEDEIPGQPFVFGDLRGLQNRVQVFADGLGFEIAQDRFIQFDFEIGRRPAWSCLVWVRE